MAKFASQTVPGRIQKSGDNCRFKKFEPNYVQPKPNANTPRSGRFTSVTDGRQHPMKNSQTNRASAKRLILAAARILKFDDSDTLAPLDCSAPRTPAVIHENVT
jgi:hypothetical protein